MVYLGKPGAGRKSKDPRLVFEGIVYVLRTGCQWKALPAERFGSYTACTTRGKSFFLHSRDSYPHAVYSSLFLEISVKNVDENTITDVVNGRIAETTTPRLKDIVTSLTRHLHAFAREVQLTEDEWMAGIQFLTEVGHMCSDKRQEFILLSDTLGLSMLVTAQNNKKPKGCTDSTVFGPFHVEDSPQHALGDDIANGAKGEPCFVHGRVTGIDGKPIQNAQMEVWQADENGFYDVQYDDLEQARARATLHTGPGGEYHFRSIVANSYPIPHDGPVGKMLRALGRHPWRPAHLHFMIRADGYEPLITHVFRNGDKYLDSDAVFGVRQTLIADWIPHEAGKVPNGTFSSVPFYTLDFDFVLNPLSKI